MSTQIWWVTILKGEIITENIEIITVTRQTKFQTQGQNLTPKNPTATCDSLANVSRASRQLRVISWSSDWFSGFPASFVIGQHDCVVFVVRYSIENYAKKVLTYTCLILTFPYQRERPCIGQ